MRVRGGKLIVASLRGRTAAPRIEPMRRRWSVATAAAALVHAWAAMLTLLAMLALLGFLAFSALLALAATARPAGACGHCLEDKMAATYDHAVVTRALARGARIVFTEIRVASACDPVQVRRAVRRSLERAASVEGSSVRISIEPLAASFVCSSGGAERQIVNTVNRALAPRGVELRVIHIMAEGARVARR